MYKLASLLVVFLAIATGSAQAQSLSISYQGNLLTIRCENASLGQVFEQIQSATGMELFLEDPVKSRRITADIDAQPLNLAVERLLAGVGVNYAMMYDPEDWQQVAKLFVGEGGGPLASSQPATGRAVRRAEPIEDNYDPTAEFEDEYVEEEVPEEEVPAADESGFIDEAGAAEAEENFTESVEDKPASQDYLPPPPSFPRSRFTPGLESSPFGANEQPAEETTSPSRTRPPTRPPAYYPFTDQFGRPIPVPPDPNDPNAQPTDEETPEESPQGQQ
ncbi:MAG: hypothetical protein ACRD1X_08885 [Vicinamibacteria bacterium]